jgi:hypothetical protein
MLVSGQLLELLVNSRSASGHERGEHDGLATPVAAECGRSYHI